MEGKEITKRFTFNWFVNDRGEADCGVTNKGYAICRAPRYQEKEKWDKHASLICDALEIEFKTRLTPSQLHSELEKAKELIERLKNDFAKSTWTEDTYKAIDSFLEGSGNKTK